MRYLFAMLLLLTLDGVSHAHDLQLTGMKILWNPDGVTVSVVTHAAKLGRGDADSAIRGRVNVKLDDATFIPGASTLTRDTAHGLVLWQAQHAGKVERVEVLSRLYPEDPQSRLVVTVFKNGRIAQETLLDAAHPTMTVGAAAERIAIGALIGRFLQQGVLHIFGGFDHIAFVCGLLLLGGTLMQLLKTVTAFTVAHSITLTLAATGLCAPSPRVVEPIIALSIIFVGIENLRARRRRGAVPQPLDLRPWLAFGFGLIHGFGFAGALAEVGLPRAGLVWALPSFNIGVEFGQAVIVLLVAPVLAWLALARPAMRDRVLLGGSTAVAALGLMWFVQRVAQV